MPTPRLDCGVSYDELLSQVADRAPARDPEHQRSCVRCRATLAELETLWAPVHDLAGDDVRAPSQLLTAVMARVRELPRHTWHAVIPADRGQILIAARVVAAVARLAAEQVPSVTLALGSGRTAQTATRAEIAGPQTATATDVAVAGTHVVVDVQVAVRMGTHIAGAADQVRANITHQIAAHLGLTAAEVNVTIADVQARTEPQ